MMPDMHIEYAEQPDLRTARRAHRLFMRRRFLFVLLYGGIIFLLGLYVLVFFPTTLAAFGVVGIAAGVVVFFELELVVRFRVSKHRDSLLRPARTVLDDEGVHTVTDVSSADLRWPAVSRIIENSEFWILRHDTGIGKIVPKAALTPQQRAQLAGFLAQGRRPGARTPG